MKMNPSIALFAVSALLAGVAGAQEKAAETPAADQPKQEKEITVSPEQMKKDLGYFLGFQSGQQLGSIPPLLLTTWTRNLSSRASRTAWSASPPRTRNN